VKPFDCCTSSTTVALAVGRGIGAAAPCGEQLVPGPIWASRPGNARGGGPRNGDLAATANWNRAPGQRI
jgi:hypothetical protein